jgi:hypothetical protein
MAYVVTVRIAIATQRGLSELIHDGFGPLWRAFALGNLLRLFRPRAERSLTPSFVSPGGIAFATSLSH